MRFINVAGSGKSPVYIDANDVSTVFDGKDEGSDGNSIRVSGIRGGHNCARLYKDRNGANGDDIAAKLAAEGVTLCAIPLKWPGNTKDEHKDYGRYLVNPAAFEYIITSEASLRPGASEPSCAIILSVSGHGLIESYDVPVSAVDVLLEEVWRIKPDIRDIDAKRATARFYNPGMLVYDPAQILTIYPNGNQVNVRFETGNVIDFDLPRRDWGNHFLNVKFNRAEPEKQQAFREKYMNSGNHDVLYDRLEKFKSGMENRVRREFARAVAADATNLVQVSNMHGPLYHVFNRLSAMSLHVDEKREAKAILAFSFPEKSPEVSGFGGGTQAYFKDKASAEAEMQRLSNILARRTP